jgi:hypothetical protein
VDVTSVIAAALAAKSISSQEVAMGWCQGASEREIGDYSPATVESRFSELLNGKVKGIRFFGKTRPRVKLLAEELGLQPSDLHDAFDQWRSGADNQRIRTYVDLTGVDCDESGTRAMFVEVEEKWAANKSLCPMAVRITDSQFRWLPRTYDELPGVEVLREAAPEPELAEGALVLTSTTHAPPDNGAVFGWHDGHLQVVPEDALNTYLADGVVRVPCDIQHPVPEDIRVEPVDGLLDQPAWRLRRYVFELADQNRAAEMQLSIGRRAALAKSLGVTATTTASERQGIAQHAALRALHRLGYDPRQLSEDQWQQVRLRAAVRSVEDVTAIVSGTMRVLNPTREVPSMPYLECEQIESRVPAIQLLRQAVEGWTEDDWMADPSLIRVCEGLVDGEARDSFEVGHARATLLHHGAVSVTPAPPQEADLEAVRLLLGKPCPPSSLLVHARPTGTDDLAVRLSPRQASWLSRSKSAVSWSVESLGPWQEAPPSEPCLIARDDTPVVWGPSSQSYGFRARRRPTEAVIHHEDASTQNWLEAFEHSFKDSAPRRSRNGLSEPDHEAKVAAVPSRVWQESDRLVSAAWWALRKGLDDVVVRRHNHELVVRLGPRLLGQVRVRPFGSKTDPPWAAVAATWSSSHSSVAFIVHYDEVEVEIGRGTEQHGQIVRRVPRVRIGGHGLILDIVGMPDPFGA